MKKVFSFLVLLLLLTSVSCTLDNMYSYTFVDSDGTVLSEGKGFAGSKIIPPTNPVKESTEEFEFEFIGWDKEVDTLEDNIIFVAQYQMIRREYTYKFVNDDGSVLKEEKVEYGTMPVAPSNPTKSGDDNERYTFIGWDKEVEKVTSDVIYKAIYKEEKNSYTYKFVDYDGSIIKEETVLYGTMPSMPTPPSRKGTAEFSYTFIGWDKDVEKVTSDVIYKAIYKEEKNSYTYKFVDYDGSIIKEETVLYGTMPEAPVDPSRPRDDKASYEFVKWDKEIEKVTCDVVYIAVYKANFVKLQYSDLVGKKVSILGDSISTFYQSGSPMNSYYTETGRYYYPTYCPDVKSVDKTWWAQLLNNTKMMLGINNSWSGSTAVGDNESAGCSDARLNTLVENGNPDIVILYLGTNDVCAGYTPTAFIEAYEVILEKIYELCPTQVYVCTLGYSEYQGMKYTDANRILYNEAIRAFAIKHNLGIIPIDEYVMEDNYKLYLNDYLHYKYKGTTLLSQICEKSICEYNGIEYTKEVEVEHPVPEPKGHIRIDAYNTGVWTIYETSTLLYSYDALNQESSYIYFYIVGITKDGDNYKVSHKKDVNIVSKFEKCDYFILISSSYPSHKFYDDINVGDTLVLIGDLTSGKCEFQLTE